MAARLKVKIETVNGWTRVSFSGAITEDAVAPLRDAAKSLGPNCQFDLAHVSSMNSCGLAEWVTFLKTACAGKRIVLDRCPPTFIDCLNIAPAVAAGAVVRTVLMPTRCDGGHDAVRLLAVEDYQKKVPVAAAVCATCGKATRDALALEDYLAFLEQERDIG